MRVVLAILSALAILVIAPLREAQAGEPLKVLLPDKENLQFMSFWVAKGGGFFAREGIELEIVTAEHPTKAESMFVEGAADAAVLPPPMYLRLIAEKKPVVIVASLLRNDPIDLVVRRDVLEARRLTREMPLAARVHGMEKLRIGVAPHPVARLRALLATQGMTEKDVELVILRGPDQNAAFEDKRVDALYAHTPFLERAILNDGGIVLIEPSSGEVKELAAPMVHGFAFHKSVYAARTPVVLAAVRALAAAQKSIHSSQKEAVDALARELPSRDRRELETIVRLYEPAIPVAPDVHAEDLAPALALFPEGMPKPDLTGIDLAPFVAASVARAARADDGGQRARWIVIGVGIAVVLGIILAVRSGRRPPGEPS